MTNRFPTAEERWPRAGEVIKEDILYDAVITSLPGMDKTKPAPGPSFLKGYLEPLGFKIKVEWQLSFLYNSSVIIILLLLKIHCLL